MPDLIQHSSPQFSEKRNGFPFDLVQGRELAERPVEPPSAQNSK
jgi:hypothetical protein